MDRPTVESGSAQDASAAPRVRRERVVWIDLFRGAAVLVMIETHVVNTFLLTAVRAEGWFTVLNYLNGLVAPSFLFIAGFVQGMERGVAPDRPVNCGRRARQLLLLLGIAYALHFPWTELGQRRWDDAWRTGTQVDVLQCIAASLGLLLGVTWVAQSIGGRRGQWVWWFGLSTLLAGVVLLSPHAATWNGLPIVLQGWVNRSTGSWFPLFSWASFVFLGALAGAIYGVARRSAESPETNAGPATLGTAPLQRRGTSVFLVTPVPLAVSSWIFRGTAYSSVSPASFFERAAWVLVFAAFCEWFATRYRPALPLFAGQYSLTLYVVHLLLISTLVGAGVPMTSISLAGVLSLIAAVAAASLGLTWAIGQARQLMRHRRALHG